MTGRRAGPLMIVGSSTAVLTSNAITVPLFASLGPLPTGALRFTVAAALLLIVARPRSGGRTRREWATVVALGGAMTVMYLALYQANDLIPLGTAATVQFTGPLLVAALGVRRARESLWVVLAGGGVVLLSDPFSGTTTSSTTWWGLGWAGLAAAGWAGYVLLNQAVGRQSTGLDGLAFAVAAAAVLTLPLAARAVTSASTADLGTIALSAGLGIALAFVLEMQALRCTSAKTVSILFSLEPAIAVVVGLVLLAQRPTLVTLAGVGCVMGAGIGITRSDHETIERRPAS